MGIAFNAAFQKSVRGVGKLGGDYMSIEPALTALDKLAKAKKLKELSNFISFNPSEVADMMDMDEEELNLPPEAWYAAEEGLTTVRGLIKALAAPSSGIKGAKPIAADLGKLAEELEAAAKQKVKFHFVTLD